jgi:hypothetical protein
MIGMEGLDQDGRLCVKGRAAINRWVARDLPMTIAKIQVRVENGVCP